MKKFDLIYLENATVVNVNDYVLKKGHAGFILKGFAIYVEGKGFLAFKAHNGMPYVLPKKRTMQEVLNGGFVSMDDIEFVK